MSGPNPYSEPNPYQSPSAPGEPKTIYGDAQLASRLTRLGGRMVDGFIGMLVSFPLMFATGYWDRAMARQVGLGEVALWTVAGFVAYLIIHGYLLASRGQTVGKLLVGVRIVDYHTGNLVPVAKIIGLRDLPIMLISVVPCLGPIVVLIDILMIFGIEQRCLHDVMAGTKVVEVTSTPT